MSFKAREIEVGGVQIGGDQPIVIQSMTTTDTMDIPGTLQQVRDLVAVGCQLVRITAPTVQDAEALREIRDQLRAEGITVPLVADIHFVPAAAMVAADYVEKVRINPGNYADRKMFKVREYTDGEYDDELARIHEKFKPLVLKLQASGKALRIGTNHGSLSDRILNRYGDTPAGMVASAFEFAEICRSYDFHNFCFSMKASNVGVMVQAYRLLVQRQIEAGWNYPIHLGVTEAGDGEDGRLKSAIGIGTLLEEGIGDTIRVSLTEAAVKEIPAARAIALRFGRGTTQVRREYKILEAPSNPELSKVWYKFSAWDRLKIDLQFTKLRPDVVLVSEEMADDPAALLELHSLLKNAYGSSIFQVAVQVNVQQAARQKWSDQISLLAIEGSYPDAFASAPARPWVWLTDYAGLLRSSGFDPRKTVLQLQMTGRTEMDRILDVSCKMGSALVDLNLGGVLLSGGANSDESWRLAYGVLQATRRRMSKTEYISCPSCGRTLFDLEETTARIKNVTSHLKGVKIAVMGCIVNGPGEMADADFGYVGGAPGKVNLYVGKECVERNIGSAEAPDRLVGLIKRYGRWVEPLVEDGLRAASL